MIGKNKIILSVIMVLAFLVCCPIAFLFIGSIMGTSELARNLDAAIYNIPGVFPEWSLIPQFPTLKSYVDVLFDQIQFLASFWNTNTIAFGVIMGQLLVGVPAAWGFAIYKFPLRKILFAIYISLMLLPFQVLMLSEYLVLHNLNLINTVWSVILPGAFSTFPVFIMHNFFRRIPFSIIEAARIDGANEIQIFLRIGVSLGRPGIIAAMILSFLEYWSVIEQPLVFYEDISLWPLSLYLPSLNIDSPGMVFAASIIALIPSILVFLIGQSNLQNGIAATAVKE